MRKRLDVLINTTFRFDLSSWVGHVTRRSARFASSSDASLWKPSALNVSSGDDLRGPRRLRCLQTGIICSFGV